MIESGLISKEECAAFDSNGASPSDIKLAILVRDELTTCFCSKREDLPTALEIHLFRNLGEAQSQDASELIDAIIRCNDRFLEEAHDGRGSAGCEATTVAKAIRWANAIGSREQL